MRRRKGGAQAGGGGDGGGGRRWWRRKVPPPVRVMEAMEAEDGERWMAVTRRGGTRAATLLAIIRGRRLSIRRLGSRAHARSALLRVG